MAGRVYIDPTLAATSDSRRLDMAERMRRIRLAFGPEFREFCRRFHFTEHQWSEYETGRMWPTLSAARQLKRQIKGLTLDWIFDGGVDGLASDLERRLMDADPFGGGDGRPLRH